MNIEKNYAKEFEMIEKAYEQAGGDVSNLLSKDIVSIIISGDKILGKNTVEGIDINIKKAEDGVVDYEMIIQDNIKLDKPIHLCVGFLKNQGEQYINVKYKIGNNCDIKFLSHCSFPFGKIHHKMDSEMIIGENSVVFMEDEHFHNEKDGIFLETNYYTKVGENSVFDSRFKLTKSRAGKLKINMIVDLEKSSKALLESKVWGKKDDELEIREIVNLNGEKSSGIAKSYIFAQDSTKAEVINEAYGNAPYSKGHIECTEISKGSNVNISTIPILRVKNDLAELTHEASVGRVNPQQLETLMAKGLDEDEATELIIKGILK
jgi:Fe-S cluster assembly scaffold protein SufB